MTAQRQKPKPRARRAGEVERAQKELGIAAMLWAELPARQREAVPHGLYLRVQRLREFTTDTWLEVATAAACRLFNAAEKAAAARKP